METKTIVLIGAYATYAAFTVKQAVKNRRHTQRIEALNALTDEINNDLSNLFNNRKPTYGVRNQTDNDTNIEVIKIERMMNQ